MIVHIEQDLINDGPMWEGRDTDFWVRLAKIADRVCGLRENVLVVLFDEIKFKEVTLVSPDREDILIFKGTPNEARGKIRQL